jgi:hypothetical protein
MEKIGLPPCDDELVLQTWLSVYSYPALIVADKLKIFETLAAGSASLAELRKKLDLGEKSAESILALMRSTGFLSFADGKFGLTDVARTYMLPDSAYYWGGMLHSSGWVSLAGKLMDAVQREREQQHAGHALVTQWKDGSIKPEVARSFTGAMNAYSLRPAMAMAMSDIWKGVKNLLELGAGSGICSIAVAMHNPEINCTIVDLPVVTPISEEYIAKYGTVGRVKTVPGDMFNDSWPSGHDAILFSQIFHDWGPEKNELLTRKSFDLLPSGGRLYVLEVLMDDDKSGPAIAAALSIAMLLRMEGKQPSFTELRELVEKVGFVDAKVVGKFGHHSVVCATKP